MTHLQKRWSVRFLVGFTVLCSMGLVALVIAEAYIRWSLNQNFTFLGGNGLPSIALLVLGLMLGLVYLVSRDI